MSTQKDSERDRDKGGAGGLQIHLEKPEHPWIDTDREGGTQQ